MWISFIFMNTTNVLKCLIELRTCIYKSYVRSGRWFKIISGVVNEPIETFNSSGVWEECPI